MSFTSISLNVTPGCFSNSHDRAVDGLSDVRHRMRGRLRRQRSGGGPIPPPPATVIGRLRYHSLISLGMYPHESSGTVTIPVSTTSVVYRDSSPDGTGKPFPYPSSGTDKAAEFEEAMFGLVGIAVHHQTSSDDRPCRSRPDISPQYLPTFSPRHRRIPP